MRITTISVTELFGLFNHTVPLNPAEHITIVYGPNGYGKTFLLNVVDALFNGTPSAVEDVPFRRFRVDFDDGRAIILTREGVGLTGAFTLSLAGQSGEEQALDDRTFDRDVRTAVEVRHISTERLMRFSDTTPDRPMIMVSAERMRTILARRDDPALDEKTALLARIINSRFNHKTIRIDHATGFAFASSTGQDILPGQLSSGEQHAVVILFELLFLTPPRTLILIDEPELSLHISWQQRFISDMGEVMRFGDYDILIATHSPQIIHDRWDLTVELKGPGE